MSECAARESGSGVRGYLVVQDLILRSHARQKGVLSQVVPPAAELLVSPLDLLVQRLDVWRQEAAEPELFPLGLREGGALVELRAVQQLVSLRVVRGGDWKGSSLDPTS